MASPGRRFEDAGNRLVPVYTAVMASQDLHVYFLYSINVSGLVLSTWLVLIYAGLGYPTCGSVFVLPTFSSLSPISPPYARFYSAAIPCIRTGRSTQTQAVCWPIYDQRNASNGHRRLLPTRRVQDRYLCDSGPQRRNGHLPHEYPSSGIAITLAIPMP